MDTRDRYRDMDTDALLAHAREQGIDPDMAVVLSERLEITDNECWRYTITHRAMGGRYTFKQRSEEYELQG